MHAKYPKVFSPIKLGPIELPNRFYFSPHGVHLTVGSKPSDSYVAYQAARAEGGCGMVACSMTVTDRGRHSQPSPYLKDNIPAFRALADAVHKGGAKMFAQLWYHWLTNGHWAPWSTAAPSLAPSKNQLGHGDRTNGTHEMGKDEIKGVVNAFRQSTLNLREAGFDGVMIHVSHAGMIEQFLSPYFNRRTDEYGGSFENRMRFMIECLQAAREGAAGKLAVGIRLNCDEIIAGGYGQDFARDVLKKVVDLGLIDFVDLDVAIEPQQLHLGMPPVFVEPHVYEPYVAAVRSAAGKIPVLSVLGRLTSIADAERAIASGTVDLVGCTRQLIAEPQTVNYARDGKEELGRTCIACNWCLMAPSEGAQGCTINPASFHERLWGLDTFKPAAKKSKVVVVGGGPGGLEAARVAAIKGHDVTLLEGRDKLGGAVALWATLPGREVFQKGIDWWEAELGRRGVKIKKNTQATAAMVLAEKPDAVIIATGGQYSKGGHSSFLDRDIPGFEQSFVYRPDEILLKGIRPTGKVVLLDGEGLHASVGVAELLGKNGADVEYVTPNFTPVSVRLQSNQDVKFIMKRLHAAKVKLTPTSYIKSIGKNEVTIYNVHTDEERTITGVNAVVLSTGRESVNDLAKELDGKVDQLFTVGDALAARVFANASYEGQKFARLIGEPGAPKTFCEQFFSKDPAEYYPKPADAMPKAAE